MSLPQGESLEQADGTAWMAFFCVTMLAIALELAQDDPAYEDVASKFFEHFVGIADAMNSLGGTGLWDEQDGFYYDQLKVDGRQIPLRTRSLVGLMPLIAVEVIETAQIDQMLGFKKRMDWFLRYREDLKPLVTYGEPCSDFCHRMLALPTQQRLKRALRYMLDENEFQHVAQCPFEPLLGGKGQHAVTEIRARLAIGDEGLEVFAIAQEPVHALLKAEHLVDLGRLDHFDGNERHQANQRAGTQGDLPAVHFELVVIKAVLFVP